jgi:hypothetical protein
MTEINKKEKTHFFTAQPLKSGLIVLAIKNDLVARIIFSRQRNILNNPSAHQL